MSNAANTTRPILIDSTSLYSLAFMSMETNWLDLHALAGASHYQSRVISAVDIGHAKDVSRQMIADGRYLAGLQHSVDVLYKMFVVRPAAAAAASTNEEGFRYDPALDPTFHNAWILCHAVLICWTFGWVLRGAPGPILPTRTNEQECREYLERMHRILREDPSSAQNDEWCNRTTGLLLVMREVLQFSDWELLPEFARMFHGLVVKNKDPRLSGKVRIRDY